MGYRGFSGGNIRVKGGFQSISKKYSNILLLIPFKGILIFLILILGPHIGEEIIPLIAALPFASNVKNEAGIGNY